LSDASLHSFSSVFCPSPCGADRGARRMVQQTAGADWCRPASGRALRPAYPIADRRTPETLGTVVTTQTARTVWVCRSVPV
jgi:hypothetical protein